MGNFVRKQKVTNHIHIMREHAEIRLEQERHHALTIKINKLFAAQLTQMKLDEEALRRQKAIC